MLTSEREPIIMKQAESHNFKWVQAGNIKGHENIVELFKASSFIEDLPENYVIKSDEYYVDYDDGYSEHSKISEAMPYVPRRGTLTEATKIGRDEPDIFYKLLAKKNYGGSYGSTYKTPCDLLFVRTTHKQLYERTHKLTMTVDKDYFDSFNRLRDKRQETETPMAVRLMYMALNGSAMEHTFSHKGTRIKPIRVNAAEYDARKRREKAIEQQTPKWADKDAINRFHTERARLNKLDGANTWAVDHIVPLQNDIVSGLNVEWNLEIILARKNAKKSNKFESNFHPLLVNWLRFKKDYLKEYSES